MFSVTFGVKSTGIWRKWGVDKGISESEEGLIGTNRKSAKMRSKHDKPLVPGCIQATDEDLGERGHESSVWVV